MVDQTQIKLRPSTVRYDEQHTNPLKRKFKIEDELERDGKKNNSQTNTQQTGKHADGQTTPEEEKKKW